jgi:hypothetical protein
MTQVNYTHGDKTRKRTCVRIEAARVFLTKEGRFADLVRKSAAGKTKNLVFMV